MLKISSVLHKALRNFEFDAEGKSRIQEYAEELDIENVSLLEETILYKIVNENIICMLSIVKFYFNFFIILNILLSEYFFYKFFLSILLFFFLIIDIIIHLIKFVYSFLYSKYKEISSKNIMTYI